MNAIEERLREHSRWVAGNADRIEVRELRNLTADLAERSFASLRCVPDSLQGLAIVHGARGMAGLSEGRIEAKEEVARSIDYWAVSLEIRAKLYFEQPSRLTLTNDATLAACLVCASRNWATSAEKLLRRFIESPESLDREYYEQWRFEPFVLACCDLVNGERSLVELKAPYAAVLQHWRDVDRLGSALQEVCEYHSHNSNDTGQTWAPEFGRVPFDIFPCEVLLVRRIRAALGLPMPVVEHELVSFFDDQIGELHDVDLDQILESVLPLLS